MAGKSKQVRTFHINEWHVCISVLYVSVAFLLLQWLTLDTEVRSLKKQLESRTKDLDRSCKMYADPRQRTDREGSLVGYPRAQPWLDDRPPGAVWPAVPRGAAHQGGHLQAGRPPIPHGMQQHAPGEMGTPVITDPARMDAHDNQLYEDGWKKHSFNAFASDLISVRRQLGDIAGPACKQRSATYRTDLPNVGVVIIFHNEAWSTLIRTVHSVIDRTPPTLLKEIILVDDFSDAGPLKGKLDDYVATLDKVKVIRAGERQGLIRARLLGFAAVTAEVAMFLDAHCECTEGWLEPLLDRIVRDKKTVAVPVADRIHFETMAYEPGNGSEMFCGFEWDMTFNWFKLPERERQRRKDALDPVRSPTFLGCCFAIHVEYFQSLGTYDTGLNIWGGEHLELSFKTWMCGGKLEIVPCSHVGHLFRDRLPFSFQGRKVGDTVRENNARLVEVWLPNYKHFFYDRIYYEKIKVGEVSDRIKMKKDLKCKSFDWYLENIYPELYIPYDCKATGMIKIRSGEKDLCIQSNPSWFRGGEVRQILQPCSTDVPPQHWTLTRENHIRRDEGCLIVSPNDNRVVINKCDELTEAGTWQYTTNNTIIHDRTGKCLTLSAGTDFATVDICNEGDTQIWQWQRRTLTLKPEVEN